MSDNLKEKLNKAYIENKLSGIFEPMVNGIFLENPDDCVKYLELNY